MSRPLHARPTTPSTGRGPGRHRIERTGGLRVTDLPAVRQRLFAAPPAGRHTWSFLAGSGGRPRTAFAIILSL
jgi:hypothetical protein